MDTIINSYPNIISSIIGFIIGLIIGLVYIIFYKSNYDGPNSKDVINLVFKDKNGNCFQLKPVVHICPISDSMNE